jgi:hypothetical protein
MEESVLRGNAAILKCHISTFVTEYVSVSSWIISEGDTDELEIKAESNDLGIYVNCFTSFITSFPPSQGVFMKHWLFNNYVISSCISSVHS